MAACVSVPLPCEFGERQGSQCIASHLRHCILVEEHAGQGIAYLGRRSDKDLGIRIVLFYNMI